MRITADRNPEYARLTAETLPQELRVQMPVDALARAVGLDSARYDWAARAGGPALDVDNPSAEIFSDGPPFDQAFDDGTARLQSGAPGRLVVEDGQAPEPRLLMPRSFTLLMSQQWARSGALPLHAGAFEFDGRGVLVLGRRGAGKSVTSMAALAAGARLVSDDWVLLAPDRSGQPAVERMREFFMLRGGWAAEQLIARLPDLPFVVGHRPKSAFWLQDRSDPRFPAGCAIEQLWVLERPRAGRGARTSSAPMAAATAMARLIESSTALLFGGSFPHERQAALHTLRLLIGRVTCRTVVAGVDLVEQPQRVIAELLGDSATPCNQRKRPAAARGAPG